MARWHDITRDPEYQDLSPEVKLEVKKGFFDRTIAIDPEFQTLSQEGKEATFEEFMQTPDDTGQGYVSSMLGAAGRGFGEVVPGAIEGVGALTGLEGLRETGEELRSGLESISPVNPIYAESVPVKLAGVGGQIGSVLATAGAGGLAGKALGGVGAVSKGAKAASLGSAFLQGAAEGAREAEQYGMKGPEAYLRTLAGGATEAGTELLPFGMAAETALAKRVLAGIPRTGTFLGATASEGAEESLAQIGSNIATKLLAPTGVETPDLTAGALEAGLYGAAGGAMLGGVNALISTPPERQTQIQKDLQAETGAIPKNIVPDQTNEEKLAAMKAGGTTVVDPDGKTAVIPPQQPEEPSMPSPEEVAVQLNTDAAKSLEATGSSESAKAQAGFDATLKEILPKTTEPTIPTVEEAEKAEPEVTPSPTMEQAAAPAVEEPTLTPEPELYALAQVPSEESVYEEPQDRTEGRKAEETSVGDRLLRPAEGEVEEKLMPSPEVAADPFAAAPLVDNLPALIAVRDNNATPEQVQSLVDQGLVEQVEGQNIITEAGVAAMPEDQRPKLTPAERAAEVEGMAVPLERDLTKPYANIAVPDLEKLSSQDWYRRRDYLEGKLRNNQQEKAELLKTLKQNWESQEYNENARINEVAASLRAAIQDMQLARPDLEAEFREKRNPQKEGKSNAKVIPSDDGGGTTELRLESETLQRVSEQPRSTEIGGYTATAGSEVQPNNNVVDVPLLDASPDVILNTWNKNVNPPYSLYQTGIISIRDIGTQEPQFSTTKTIAGARPKTGTFRDYIIRKQGWIASHYIKAGKRPSKIYAEAVDVNNLELPSSYVKQGELYIYNPGAVGQPTQVAPFVAQAAKATAPGPISQSSAKAGLGAGAATAPEGVIESPTAPAEKPQTAKVATVKSTELSIGDEVSFKGNTYRVKKILSDGRVRAEFTNPEGIARIPKGLENITTLPRNVNFTRIERQPSVVEPIVAEKPSPAPLREGAGVPGVVQAEPVEGSIPTVGQVSPETETSSRENLGPKVAAAEQKQAADDQVKKKRQSKKDNATKKALNSVLDSEKKNPVQGSVSKADVEFARDSLTNSGELPNAYLTRIYASVKAFLADKNNAKLFPSTYARLQTEDNIEGLFENGQTLVFAENVAVSDLDRRLADILGITPEQAAARRVIAHENGHKAIALFTFAEKKEFIRYIRQMYSDEQIDNLVKTYTEYADWKTNPDSRNEALEELFLKDFEKLDKIPTGGIWDDIVKLLKRIWQRLTGRKDQPTLKNLKDVALLMRNAMKRSDVPLGSFTLKNGGNVKLSFAGEKAIENLPPERQQFMRDSLETAKAMAAAGKSSKEIRAVTGWFPGKYDGKMRWEVPDEGVALTDKPELARLRKEAAEAKALFEEVKKKESGFSPAFNEAQVRMTNAQDKLRKAVGEGDLTTLGERLVHPDFFALYPAAKNIRLVVDAMQPNYGGYFDPISNKIAINSMHSDKMQLSSLLHEIQHWIQKQEGFAEGGDLSQFLYSDDFKLSKEDQDTVDDIDSQIAKLRKEERDLGEFFRNLPDSMKGAGKSVAESRRFEAISYEIRALNDRRYAITKPARNKMAMDKYRKTAGEIEARDVQDRKDFTPEQRKAIEPYSSENIALEDAIVIFNGGKQASVQFASDASSAFTAGSEAARSTIYNERDIDVREAIRSAYEAMPKDTGIAVPIGDLFAKTEELMPDVTQDEFSNVLQDLFEDNGAVLQEGEQIIPEQEVEIQAFEKDNPFNEIIRKSPEKSPSLGEINGVSKKFVQRVLRPASSFATNNGIRIDDNAPLQARAMPDGSIIIGYSLSQERFDELQKMAPQAASQYTKDSIIEELIHLSDLIGLRNQWIKSDKKISFDQFVLGQQSNLAFSLIQKADSLNDLEAESLRRILASSLSLYSNNPAIVNLGLNELLDLASQYPYILPELVRSLIQLKKTGQLTETAFRKIANVLREWQEIVLQWISEGYVSAKEGVFGEMLSERIKNAENNLVQLSGTSEINVTTPEGRRAGFVVVMPRPSKASRIPIENAEEASKSFKVDLAEAGKGRVETKAKFKGKPLKDTEIPEHNVKSYDLYRDAAIKLIDDLMAETNDILVVAEALQDPEFQIAVGLQVSKDVSSDMITIARSQIGLEIENRLANEIKKERNPRRKRELELAEKRGIIYYNAGTGAGQALQNRQEAIADPRYRSRILFTQAKLHKENKAKEKLDAITGGTEKITDIITGAEEKAAEETTQAEVEAQESAVEDDQDAIDLAAGEATLKDPERSLYEEYKDLLREEGILARLDELDNIKAGSKASISTERRNELANLTREERTKLREKNKQRRMEILAKLLGKEEEAKTSEQKVTRTKRKKMVDTAKKRVEAGKDIETSKEGETESSEEQVSKAERTAQEILKDLSERYADPIIFPDRESKINEMRELYKERVKQGVGPNQMTEKSFVNKAVELGADEKTAGILWKAAELEIDAREAMRQDKILQRKAAVGARADAQAHRIIFAKERLKRQSGFAGIDTNPNKDTIIQAFRDQVKNPASLEDFVARLKSLNVSETVAKRLFTAAEREKADLEAMEAFKALEGPDALKRMLNEMNKARPADSVPLERAMPWRKILSSNPKDVAEYRQRIFEAISDLPSFQNLTEEQKERLADLYAEAWENRRQAILDRMLRDEIKKARDRDEISEDVEKKLQQSRNKILEIMNLGGFNNDDLVKILGERYGISTSFTEEQKARIQKLADQLQDEDMNTAKRNKLAMEFAVELAGAMDVPVSEIISNWWTSSVLFGPQTIFSIGAAFLNGGYSIATIGTSRMLTKLIQGDIQGAIEESILMLKGFARYLGAFKQSGNRAWNYLWTGDVGLLGAGSTDILNEINNFDKLQKFQRHKLLAEQLAKDPRMVRRYVGVYLRFVSRLLTALDAFNVMVTKAGTASLALRMSGMSTDKIIEAEKMLKLKAYKEQVIRDYFDNKAPQTSYEKALVDSYAEAEMYRAVNELGGKMENADYLASESAMTMQPTGFGGVVYDAITGFFAQRQSNADEYLEKMKKDWINNKDLKAVTFLALAYLRQFAAYNAAGLTGSKFVRYASNKFNQGISFIPFAGLLRQLEAKDDKIKGKDAFRETIYRNQVVSFVMLLVGAAVIRAIQDEPDDEERGNFWNGGWANLTPDQKKQMLAKGQKEYTMGFKYNGRWYVFNYQNWPLNQVLSAIGSMSDQIRFSPEKWDEKNALSKSVAGMVAGVKSTLEIPALSGLQDLIGNRLASKDPTEQTLDRLSRVTSGWVGGFVPRILKDIDFYTQPELRKYETLWEKTASHIPIYRRYVGEEYYDILGQQIKRNVIPGSREFMVGPTEPEYKILGALNARNIFLTPANAEYRMIGKGRNRRRLTQEEADAYSLETGRGYRDMLLRYGQRALQMPTERARAFLQDKADEVRDRALKRAYRR